jgi:small subunit ribosomal protein S18
MSEYRTSRRSRSRRPRFCASCAEGKSIDYKDSDTLRRYLTGMGKIKPRRQTGLCAKHQRELAMAVKRARHLALLSFAGTE